MAGMSTEAELHSTSETIPLSIYPFAQIEAEYNSRSAVIDQRGQRASSLERCLASPSASHDAGNRSLSNRVEEYDVQRPARIGTSIGRFSLPVSHAASLEPPAAVLPRNRALPPISLKHIKSYASSSHSSPSAKRDWPNRTKSLNEAQADLISALEAASLPSNGSPAKPRAPSDTVSSRPNNSGNSKGNVGPHEQPADSTLSHPPSPLPAQTQEPRQSPQSGSQMLNELHSQLQELQVRPPSEIAFKLCHAFDILSAPSLPL